VVLEQMGGGGLRWHGKVTSACCSGRQRASQTNSCSDSTPCPIASSLSAYSLSNGQWLRTHHNSVRMGTPFSAVLYNKTPARTLVYAHTHQDL
jgi:hypothetical protein